MKNWTIAFLLGTLLMPLSAEKVGSLPEVMKPDNITIADGELLVAEGANIYIYSLDNLVLVKKIGKEGEGPGEIQAIPNFPTRVVALSDLLLVEGPNKLLYFSRAGEYIKEFRKPGQVTRFLPVGGNFVAARIAFGDDNQTLYSSVDLYDKDIKHIKGLYRQPFVQQGAPPNIKMDMAMDFINIQVHGDKIYIEKSPDGFIVEVFNKDGEKLYEINSPQKPVKVGSADRLMMETEFREDPWTKPQIKALGGWDEAKKLFKMQFPENYPAIKTLDVADGRLIVQTHRSLDDKDEYIIMDLNGENQKRVFIPRRVPAPMMARIMGVKRYAIQNGTLYYIKENLDEEEWEIHREQIF
jgi:hypothetical protein